VASAHLTVLTAKGAGVERQHGPDSPAVLITTSESLGRRVLELVNALLPGMPTVDFAGPARADHAESRWSTTSTPPTRSPTPTPSNTSTS
jgi:hypothetical protein